MAKKSTATIAIVAAAGVGLFLFLRSRNARALGDDARSTAVRGEVSGQIYAVGIGQRGEDGRVLYSVFDPADSSSVLFTFVDVAPGEPERPEARSLLAQNNEARPGALELALRDFGFRQ